ncbi:MAG: hypothetical protein GX604_06205, partial [Actinobacteria bacterium]|nr:hypothetical protein [Actinomycetota bacterium]
VEIAPSWLDEAGAYLVRVGLVSGGREQAVYEAWLGRVVDGGSTVDVAIVVPLAAGIWQDADGTFFGNVLDEAVAPSCSTAGLSGLARLVDMSPDFNFTLAIEPVLLSQLEDMSNGYTARTASGQLEDRGRDSVAASGAVMLLNSLRSLALSDEIQCVPMPYALPSLCTLAAQGWDDGPAQVRLGKTELLRLVGLFETPRGAYPPTLELDTASIAAFSQASVDYVLVRDTVLADLAESLSDALQPVRITDAANNRLTVLPVSEALASVFAAECDVGLLCAALAHMTADGSAQAIVVAPLDEYDVPSFEQIASFAREILASGAFRLVTLDELVESWPPDRRPIYLSRYGGYAEGLRSRALLDEIAAVRGVVSDYLAAADAAASQAVAVAVKLFRAQSRHWLRSDLPPELAGEGIRYARAALAAAEEELARITIVDLEVTRGAGVGAELRVSIDNASSYSWNLILESVAGEEEERISSKTVSVAPGRNVFFASVRDNGGAEGRALGPQSGTEGHAVRILAGSTVVAVAPWPATSGWMAQNIWWWILCGVALVVVVVVVVVLGGVLFRRRGAGMSARRIGRRVAERR